MRDSSMSSIYSPSCLRMFIDLNRWENSDENKFRAASAKELFYLVAESLLDEARAPKYQTLKFLTGRFTDRAMRQRVREFEALGLISTIPNPLDVRTKQLIPTSEFYLQLNQHLKSQRQVCERHMHLIDKSF